MKEARLKNAKRVVTHLHLFEQRCPRNLSSVGLFVPLQAAWREE